jgi:cytochrome c
MIRTYITALLISPLVLLLSACQPDTPAKQAASVPADAVSPAASQPMAASQPVVQTVPVAKPAVETNPEAKPAAASTGGDELALAQKSGCLTCHAIDKKLVGPAWRAVATKYRGQKDAEAKLAAKVAKGGSGVWGSIPMPPNAPRIKDNDIKTLVHFILSLK